MHAEIGRFFARIRRVSDDPWVRKLVIVSGLLWACSSAPPAPPAAAPSSPPPRAAAPTAPPPAPPAADVPPAEPSDPLAPLPADAAARLGALRADPPPRAITRMKHYFVSNENQHWLWRDVLRNRGGMLVGVGTDQLYLYAGWSKATLLVPLDFDQWIVDLHWVYGLLFEHADTPAELVDLWTFRRQGEVKKLIEERWTDPKEQRKKLRSFSEARADVKQRLERLRKRHGKRDVDSFMSSQEQFDWIKRLWAAGRVHPVRGDLTQSVALADVAAFSRDTKIPLRTLYLSNAEDYFEFDTGHYKDNVLGLPFDDRSIVLRTKPYNGDYYEFLYQSGTGFQDWLRADRVKTMCELARFSHRASNDKDEKDLYEVSPVSVTERERNHRCD